LEETRVCGKSYSGGMATGNKFLHLVVVGRDQQPPKHYPGTRCSSYLPYAAMDSYAAFMEREREGGREGGREGSGQVHIAQRMRARPAVGVHKGAVTHPAHSAVARHGKRRHARRRARERLNLFELAPSRFVTRSLCPPYVRRTAQHSKLLLVSQASAWAREAPAPVIVRRSGPPEH